MSKQIKDTDGERFDAFISFSGDAAATIGVALGYGLTRITKPWNRLRALRIFFDETNLPAGPIISRCPSRLWGQRIRQ